VSGAPVACIITSYNNGARLADAIESVLNQSLPPEEIIVADDASDDGSREVIQRYARQSSDIIPFYREANLGPGLNRHLAIKAASRPFITQLDGDDAFDSGKVEREWRALDGRDDAIAYSDYIKHFTKDGRRERVALSAWSRLETRSARVRTVLLRDQPLPHNMLYAKALYAAAGGYATDVAMLEDWRLKLKLARNAERWIRAPGDGLIYSRHGEGLSASSWRAKSYWRFRILLDEAGWLQEHADALLNSLRMAAERYPDGEAGSLIRSALAAPQSGWTDRLQALAPAFCESGREIAEAEMDRRVYALAKALSVA